MAGGAMKLRRPNAAQSLCGVTELIGYSDELFNLTGKESAQ
jgi:hypothetical protein